MSEFQFWSIVVITFLYVVWERRDEIAFNVGRLVGYALAKKRSQSSRQH